MAIIRSYAEDDEREPPMQPAPFSESDLPLVRSHATLVALGRAPRRITGQTFRGNAALSGLSAWRVPR